MMTPKITLMLREVVPQVQLQIVSSKSQHNKIANLMRKNSRYLFKRKLVKYLRLSPTKRMPSYLPMLILSLTLILMQSTNFLLTEEKKVK